MENDIKTKLLDWAEKDEDIRALILEGSRASNSYIDEYSDYDINVYTNNPAKFTSQNEWIFSFGEVIVYQKSEFQYKDISIPTRLVIYKNISRIDFSFWPVSAFHSFKDGVYEPYKNGYVVLTDKDGLCKGLPIPSNRGFEIREPTADEFLKNIYDFYFEVCAVIKYIKRDNLWFAKCIENGEMKKLFLKAFVWLECVKNPALKRNLRIDGKRLEKSAGNDTPIDFARCFSGYDKAGTWKSLNYMASSFNALNREYAGLKGFIYPEEKVAEMMEYLHNSL
jgi:aminoglycoside 6-adenylyltransferase